MRELVWKFVVTLVVCVESISVVSKAALKCTIPNVMIVGIGNSYAGVMEGVDMHEMC